MYNLRVFSGLREFKSPSPHHSSSPAGLWLNIRTKAEIMCMAFVALLLAASFAGPPRCKGNPALVGQCFTIHGRLRAYNGNPTFRIWPIGTRRIVGVTGPKPGD